eukprot:SAG31_NODE_15646_length_744_cov_5.693023_1_plen_146_part_00
MKKLERGIPDFAKDAMYAYIGESRNQDTIHKIRAALCCMSEDYFRATTMYMTQWKMTVDERTKIYNDLTREGSSDDMSTEDKEEYQRDITRRITNLTTQVIEVKNQIEKSISGKSQKTAQERHALKQGMTTHQLISSDVSHLIIL